MPVLCVGRGISFPHCCANEGERSAARRGTLVSALGWVQTVRVFVTVGLTHKAAASS